MFYGTKTVFGDRSSVVSTATMQRSSNPGRGKEYFDPHKRPERVWGTHSPIFNGTEFISLGKMAYM